MEIRSMKLKLICYWVLTIAAAAELLVGAEWDLTHRPRCGPARYPPWLPNVCSHDPRILEAACSHRLACARFSGTQGVGVCRCFLRNDRRGCIAHSERQ